MGAQGVAPYGTRGGEAGPGTRLRGLWSEVLVTGLLLGAVAAVDPMLAVPVAMVLAGLVVGTHALLEDVVQFADLGLVAVVGVSSGDRGPGGRCVGHTAIGPRGSRPVQVSGRGGSAAARTHHGTAAQQRRAADHRDGDDHQGRAHGVQGDGGAQQRDGATGHDVVDFSAEEA